MAGFGSEPHLENYLFSKYPNGLEKLDWDYVFNSPELTPVLIRFLVSDEATARYVKWRALCLNANLTAELMIEFIDQGKPADFEVLAIHPNLTAAVLDELRKHDDLRDKYGLAFAATLDARATTETKAVEEPPKLASDAPVVEEPPKLAAAAVLTADSQETQETSASVLDEDFSDFQGYKNLFLSPADGGLYGPTIDIYPVVGARVTFGSPDAKDKLVWTVATQNCGYHLYGSTDNGVLIIELPDDAGRLEVSFADLRAGLLAMIFRISTNNHQSIYDKYLKFFTFGLFSTSLCDSKNKEIIANSLLIFAAANNHVEAVKSLYPIEGLDLVGGTDGQTTALHCAAFHGHVDCVRVLLSDPELTLADFAPFKIKVPNRDILELLVARGATFTDATKQSVWFTEMMASIEARKNWPTTVTKADFDAWTAALEAGVDVHQVLSCGFKTTPLHFAAAHGTEFVSLLLSRGVDVNAKDGNGETALYKSKTVSVVELLIKHGANVNETNRLGYTALLKFAINTNLDSAMLTVLIKNNANMDAVYGGKRTPLHFAANFGAWKNIHELLVAGADVNAKDENNETPLATALAANRVRTSSDLSRCIISLSRFGGTLGDDALIHDTPRNLSFYKDWSGFKTADHFNGPLTQNLVRSIESFYSPITVQQCIDDGAQVNGTATEKIGWSPMVSGWTPLMVAAGHYHLDAMSVLVKNGATVTDVTSKKQTVLHIAAVKCADPKIIQFLLDHGCDANATDESNNTPLLIATDEILCHPKSVDYLIKAGANVHAKSRPNGLTALHNAARHGYLEIMKILLSAGADVNATNITGCTPLDSLLQSFFQGERPRMDCLTLLLSHGAKYYDLYPSLPTEVSDILKDHAAKQDVDGQESFLRAIAHGHIDKVSKYLADGGSLDIRAPAVFGSNKGYTPLMMAIQRRNWGSVHKEILDLIPEHGADVHAVNDDGETAMHILSIAGFDTETAARLLKLGADINARSKSGATPFYDYVHWALDYKDFKFWFENGADPNVVTKDRSLLMITCWFCKPAEVQMLLDYGADPRALVDGLSALDFVCSRLPKDKTEDDRAAIIKLLIDYGADRNSYHGVERTPMISLAAQLGAIKSMEALVAKDTDHNTRDCAWNMLREREATCGQTALHVACAAGNLDAVQFCLKYGAQVNAIDNNGARPLDLTKDHPEIVALLEERGAVRQTKPYYPQWLNYVADVRDGNLEAVEKHLSAGADIDFIDQIGIPVLHTAISNRRSAVAHHLIKCGANLKMIKSAGRNALHCAISYQYFETVRVILEAGVDPNETTMSSSGQRQSAFQLIGYHGNPRCHEIIMLLRQYGAKVEPFAGTWTPKLKPTHGAGVVFEAKPVSEDKQDKQVDDKRVVSEAKPVSEAKQDKQAAETAEDKAAKLARLDAMIDFLTTPGVSASQLFNYVISYEHPEELDMTLVFESPAMTGAIVEKLVLRPEIKIDWETVLSRGLLRRSQIIKFIKLGYPLPVKVIKRVGYLDQATIDELFTAK